MRFSQFQSLLHEDSQQRHLDLLARKGIAMHDAGRNRTASPDLQNAMDAYADGFNGLYDFDDDEKASFNDYSARGISVKATGYTGKQVKQVFADNMDELPRMTLYRGWTVKNWESLSPGHDIRNGKLHFDYYLSTSKSPRIAMNFIEDSSDKISKHMGRRVGFLFRIRTMEGARGLDLDEYKKPNPRFSNEHEVILDKGSQFKVMKVKRKNADWETWCDDFELWWVELAQVN